MKKLVQLLQRKIELEEKEDESKMQIKSLQEKKLSNFSHLEAKRDELDLMMRNSGSSLLQKQKLIADIEYGKRMDDYYLAKIEFHQEITRIYGHKISKIVENNEYDQTYLRKFEKRINELLSNELEYPQYLRFQNLAEIEILIRTFPNLLNAVFNNHKNSRCQNLRTDSESDNDMENTNKTNTFNNNNPVENDIKPDCITMNQSIESLQDLFIFNIPSCAILDDSNHPDHQRSSNPSEETKASSDKIVKIWKPYITNNGNFTSN